MNTLNKKFTQKPTLKLTPLKYNVINPKSQMAYDTLMQVCECSKWVWLDGSFPTEVNKFNFFKKETCIDMGIRFDPIDDILMGKNVYLRFGDKEDYNFYKERGLRIISPSEFYKIQNLKPKIIKKINKWFDKYSPDRESKGEYKLLNS